ncbi:mandelate racemase [Rhodoferax koreense]|uniref:Mandelate racemase n=1 Tax=Rhodoferax koreensis TaxID=1842727 RepID=A0A1P8JRG4_9BURK|nr:MULTISPECIES: enolase C-terminal domain-like protein [Comamonadaceae]APW36354.1 mandelate racemase [Rhodoferax koreense]MDM0091523.1 enolase C-terminal domain-like protein [Variovorax sp. J22G40]MDM0148726.1 enolase C-terminal domain-like protein [Variovorax sp. J2P1-31]
MINRSLKIRSISARPIVIKLKRPIVTRMGSFADWPIVLVDLMTEDGVIGRSYLQPYIIKSMRYLVAALEDVGAMLKGQTVSPVDLFNAVRKSLHLIGYEGFSMIAASGVDMAAWDALSKSAQLPLCAMLGGSVGPVRCYNTNGLWLQEPRAAAEEAKELMNEGGFTSLKMRLGREKIADDLATLDAVREAVGDEVDLMVDFNQGLNLAEALQRCHLIDDHGLIWIEEPLLYDNFDGYARLAADLKTPLQMGENIYGSRELYKSIQKKASDLVMLDLMRIGGVTGWTRAAAIAGAAGLPLSSHVYPEVSAHMMRVSETAHWLEWNDWHNVVLQTPYEVKGGNLIIPDVPGVGLEWDEKAVQHYLI